MSGARGVVAWQLCLLAVLAGGCTVDQEAEVRQYREVLDPPLADMPAVDPSPATALTLREALASANRHNESLAIEGERYVQAIIERRRSVANFLPTVNLVPVWSWRADPGGGSTFDVPGEIGVTLNAFSDVARYWRDGFRIEAARHRLLDQQEQLLLDVARSYYQVLRSQATLEVLRQSVETQEQRLRDAQGRLAVGVGRPVDVALIASQVSDTRTRYINARRDVAVSRLRLSLLTWLELSRRELSDDYDVPDAPIDLDRLLADATSHRLDLLATEQALAAARQDVEVATGQYFPSLSADLAAFLYRESVPDSRGLEALVRLNLPIFSAGRIEADVREAWSFYREADLLRSLVRRQVWEQVQAAAVELQASKDRLAEARVQLASAEQAYRQAEESARVGRGTELERILAQDDLLEAQLRVASETYDRKIFYLDLLRVTGRLTPVVSLGGAAGTRPVEPLEP
jgi:outer membrane protein